MVFIVRNHKKHISHCVVIFIEFRYVTVGSAYLPLDFKELTQNTFITLGHYVCIMTRI